MAMYRVIQTDTGATVLVDFPGVAFILGVSEPEAREIADRAGVQVIDDDGLELVPYPPVARLAAARARERRA
jgi:hypothetical protein